jgi:hypothetical protein
MTQHQGLDGAISRPPTWPCAGWPTWPGPPRRGRARVRPGPAGPSGPAPHDRQPQARFLYRDAAPCSWTCAGRPGPDLAARALRGGRGPVPARQAALAASEAVGALPLACAARPRPSRTWGRPPDGLLARSFGPGRTGSRRSDGPARTAPAGLSRAGARFLAPLADGRTVFAVNSRVVARTRPGWPWRRPGWSGWRPGPGMPAPFTCPGPSWWPDVLFPGPRTRRLAGPA